MNENRFPLDNSNPIEVGSGPQPCIDQSRLQNLSGVFVPPLISFTVPNPIGARRGVQVDGGEAFTTDPKLRFLVFEDTCRESLPFDFQAESGEYGGNVLGAFLLVVGPGNDASGSGSVPVADHFFGNISDILESELGIDAIESLVGNRDRLRYIGVNPKIAEILDVRHVGE